MKTCTRCGEEKPLTEYGWDQNAGKNGRYRSRCQVCLAEIAREARESDPDKTTNYRLVWHYGITQEQYRERFDAQGGTCYICHNPETRVDGRSGKLLALAVDHDHTCCPGKRTCGKCLRGLICKRCNQVLGLIGDDPEILRSMVAYLDSTW